MRCGPTEQVRREGTRSEAQGRMLGRGLLGYFCVFCKSDPLQERKAALNIQKILDIHASGYLLIVYISSRCIDAQAPLRPYSGLLGDGKIKIYSHSAGHGGRAIFNNVAAAPLRRWTRTAPPSPHNA